jgi:O-glycosyl hydrolase
MSGEKTRTSGSGRAAACAAAACVALGVSASLAGEVDPADHGPAFQGWGTSLAWWANVAGTWGDPDEFGALMDAVFDHETGLGLTIVRLNIGAGQNPAFPAGYMTPGRQMPSYKPAPDAPYDFIADRAQQRVLLAGLSRGVRFVEANANSPPWWMTITQDSSGNPNGENLAPARYGDFCQYLADVALWYRDTLGVEFNSITPLNEPSASWWDGDGNQEGCTFLPGSHPALLTELRTRLDAVGLEELPISGPEEWSSDLTRGSAASYPPSVQNTLSHLSTHTYGANNRAGLNALSDLLQKPLWMSEYGTGAATEFESALQLARRIIGDFREMPRLEAWIIWQVLSTNHFNHTWSCMLSNFATREPGFTYRPQYHTFRQFTGFIRPGSFMLASGESDALVAFHPAQQRLVIVALNEGTSSRTIPFDLSAFDGVPGSARVFTTARSLSMFQRPDVPIGGGDVLNAPLGPESVTTFIIDGVSTASLPRTDWNADGFLDSSDAEAFLADAVAGRDHADLNLDGVLDFFDALEFLGAHDAGGAQRLELELGFGGVTTGSIGDVELGNGGDGGHYFSDGVLYVQAFAANEQNGGVAIPLDGLTLEAGVPYTVRLACADFNQGWTVGGEFVAGLSVSEPGIADSGDIGSASFSVPANNGPYPMRFETESFTVTPAEDVTTPYLLVRTDGVASGNQRIAVDSVRISR